MGWANPITKPRSTAPARTVPVALPKAIIAAARRQRADDAQQEMATWAPGVERRTTRKGPQNHKDVHKEDSQ